MIRSLGWKCCAAIAIIGAAWAQDRPATSSARIDATERSAVVGKLTKALDDGYVFPDVAKKIKARLEEKLAAKEYDRMDDGEAFARALTEDLQAISKDRHLRVRYSPQSNDRAQAPNKIDGIGPLRMRNAVQKNNAGFVKLERLPGNVGYLELRNFSDMQAGAETVTAAMNFLTNTDALILDLRKNGGGSPHMVQLICSYFFPEDKPVHLNSLYWRRGDRTDEFWTLKKVDGKRYLNKDILVLTSGYTFSGAEECAYNLQTQKRATIVGETTGGGAHPGGGVPLGKQFMVFVPSGRAINPITKTNWEGTGVVPDVAAPAESALQVAHDLAIQKIRGKLSSPEAKEELDRDLSREAQMQKAYEQRRKNSPAVPSKKDS